VDGLLGLTGLDGLVGGFCVLVEETSGNRGHCVSPKNVLCRCFFFSLPGSRVDPAPLKSTTSGSGWPGQEVHELERTGG
jgi:hypothetical protein